MKSKNFKKKLFFFIYLLIIILPILAISYFRLLDNYELETLDFRFSLRKNLPTTDKIVLIDIGEDTIEKLGRFPFDRSYHALLIKALSEAGARHIVFDIFFSEPQEDDNEMEEAMRRAGNVYLPYVFELDTKNISKVTYALGYTAKTIENLKILVKGEGHINIKPDIDGKFRRVPIYIKYKGAFYPYISFLVTCDYLGIPQKDIKILPGKYLILGKHTKIPLDDNSNMIINFAGRWGSVYQHYSYVDILQSYLASACGQKPILDLKVLKDKACIVGLTASGTVDLHPNPLEPLYPGVGIHAEVFNSILNKNFIYRQSKETNLFILIALGLFILLSTLKTKPLKGLFALIIMVIVFIGVGILIFNMSGIWIDLFCPVLAMSLVYLFLTLYKYITEWKKRLVLENELDIAKRIQESFLPRKLPEIAGVDIAAGMFTARQVGGDLYDFLEFGSEKLGVMVGDVSGKGVPASLFMAMVTGEFRSFAQDQSSPQSVLSNLNSRLVKESSSNLFVTMFYLILDLKDNAITYSNGGHLPLIHLSADEKNVRFLDVQEGAPLGLMEGGYSGNIATFKKGDIFVLYTDGITEAMNTRSEMYGKERLVSVIESHREADSRALLNAIEKDVRRFEPKSMQHDDMTIMVIKMKKDA